MFFNLFKMKNLLLCITSEKKNLSKNTNDLAIRFSKTSAGKNENEY